MKDPVKAEGLPETPRDTREVAKQPVDGLKRPAGTASEDAASLKKPRLSVKTSMSAADLQGQYEIRSFRDQQSASTSATTAADLRGKYEIRSFQDRGSSSRSDSRRHADYGSRERSRDSSSDHHRSERPSSGSSTRKPGVTTTADLVSTGVQLIGDEVVEATTHIDRMIVDTAVMTGAIATFEADMGLRSLGACLDLHLLLLVTSRPSRFRKRSSARRMSLLLRRRLIARDQVPRALQGNDRIPSPATLLQYILTAIAAVSIHPLALTIVLPRAEAATALSRTKVPPIDPAAAMRHLRAVLMCSATSLAAPRSWRTRPRA